MCNWRSMVLAAVSSLIFQACLAHAQEPPKAEPIFSNAGPDADEHGQQLGYPVGWPLDKPQNMVGNYSHADQLTPTRTVAAAEKTSSLLRAQTEISVSYTFGDTYTFASSTATLAEYLARNPTTRLLIAHDQTVLYEHYQYGRTDHDRFLSQSMAKTITAMLIGIAISEGAIHSVDDTVQTYVPELTGKEIGKTPIQAFLHMASGIAFTQTSQGADDRTSDDARLDRELFGKDKISTIDQSSALRSDARLTPSFLR